MQKLEDLLVDARVEWPNGKSEYFVPIDKFERIVTVDAVLAELKRCRFELSGKDEDALREFAETVFRTCRRLFTILTYFGHAHSIGDFLKDSIHDEHLPFLRHSTIGKNGIFKLFSETWESQKAFECTESWDRRSVEDLFRDQWAFLAPEFKRYVDGDNDPVIEHKELKPNCVLPFVKDMEYSDKRHEGGFSIVWEVKIHPAHHKLLPGAESKNPSFALKKLNSTNPTDFDSEVKMHNAFRKSSNPHLVQLLATYRLNGFYYMLFPYAKSNLRNYWKDNPEPLFANTTLNWVANQCKALTHGLLRIHRYSDTFPAKVERNAEHLYGRHGDIKPENILWFIESPYNQSNHIKEIYGILVIADFGLMAFHRCQSRSLVPGAKLHGTPAYAPPEWQLNYQISRSYDIWSLGCVYLEFITWIVSGWKGLQQFSSMRNGIGSGKIFGDSFYTLTTDKHGAPPKAKLHDGVQKWMQGLRQQQRCSEFVDSFLDLVTGMLEVDPNKRLSAAQVNSELCQMIKVGNTDARYYTQRNSKTSRFQVANLSLSDAPDNSTICLNLTVGQPLPTS